MKVGIIGLPETGKTTVFNALTRSDAALHTYGVRSQEINLGTIPVPDERFDFAVRVCRPKKKVPATLDVTDGAARIELGERGRNFGTDFFAGVRSMDALVLVLRAFHSPALPDPDGGVDPEREARTVMEELLLADLAVVEGRLERLGKNRTMKRQTPAEAAEEQALARVKAHLEAEQPVRTLELSPDEERALRGFAFVSGKPLILVANLGEEDLAAPEKVTAGLRKLAASQALPLVELCAKVEMEVAQMDPAEEREFLQALGISEPARNRLIREAYAALGYISFLTVGEDEVRAWTIRKGTTALGAAEKIHTDIARTFIRAEVMDFADFRAFGGWDAARSAGKMRLEGKDYVVKDGEIVHIRHSR
ncbi:MAG: redox-regulated ATPase YchF [Chthonomonadales bacterium]